MSRRRGRKLALLGQQEHQLVSQESAPVRLRGSSAAGTAFPQRIRLEPISDDASSLSQSRSRSQMMVENESNNLLSKSNSSWKSSSAARSEEEDPHAKASRDSCASNASLRSRKRERGIDTDEFHSKDAEILARMEEDRGLAIAEKGEAFNEGFRKQWESEVEELKRAFERNQETLREKIQDDERRESLAKGAWEYQMKKLRKEVDKISNGLETIMVRFLFVNSLRAPLQLMTSFSRSPKRTRKKKSPPKSSAALAIPRLSNLSALLTNSSNYSPASSTHPPPSERKKTPECTYNTPAQSETNLDER